MKKLVFLALIIFPAMTFAQILNQKTIDPKKNNEMLVGYCNRDGFSTINSIFDSVYKAEYAIYQADSETMNQLAGKLKGIKITLVMATWCGDSRDWVPHFYKIMDELNFNYKNLTLICVDREKKAPGTIVEELNIEKVPTFIIYRKKKELGRIIEVPVDILEKDILKILQQQ
jgi:thiol-disulfide isomerase/thioredoxin